MPYVKIWIHAVWTVKNRKPTLNQHFREDLFQHIYNNAIEKGILMECVNGYNDHVHCLFRLKNNQTVEKVMQLIKGESSFWFNKSGLSKVKLVWQKEYFAVGVSESIVGSVRKYIHNQAKHHNKKTWEDEYQEFMANFGFQPIKG